MTSHSDPEIPENMAERLTQGPADFDAAIVHLCRGEIHRLTVWRQRLDVTSNWSTLLIVALITFTLGSHDVPHFTLLLGLSLIAISILIEGRRYCHLHHCGWRLYLIESGYYASLLDPSGTPPVADWRHRLADDLRRPRLLISWFTATRVRLRRNYLMILYFVTAAWITKLFIHPQRPGSMGDFYARLAVGELIPPWFVAATAFVFVAGATMLAATCPPAERLEKWGGAFADPPDQHEAEID
jgi:uncharacterized membrane protein